MRKTRITPEHFGDVYRQFNASISKYDCGRKCAPLNGGQPVCCTTGHAIPVVHKSEYQLLKSRTDLWYDYKPNDATSRKIVKELPRNSCAIECKGAAFCERDNRTIACRAFPFFPYYNKQGEMLGLSVYWTFEDRCWMIYRLDLAEPAFVKEMAAAFEKIFAFDPEELENMKSHSASARRVHSRWNRPIPIIGRDDGKLYKVMPRTHELRPAKASDFKAQGAYKSEAAYKRAVKEAGGTLGPEPKGGYLAP